MLGANLGLLLYGEVSVMAYFLCYVNEEEKPFSLRGSSCVKDIYDYGGKQARTQTFEKGDANLRFLQRGCES